jgi:hypothetical protein
MTSTTFGPFFSKGLDIDISFLVTNEADSISPSLVCRRHS